MILRKCSDMIIGPKPLWWSCNNDLILRQGAAASLSSLGQRLANTANCIVDVGQCGTGGRTVLEPAMVTTISESLNGEST